MNPDGPANVPLKLVWSLRSMRTITRLPLSGHVTVAPGAFAPSGVQSPAAVIVAPVSTNVSVAPVSVMVSAFASPGAAW